MREGLMRKKGLDDGRDHDGGGNKDKSRAMMKNVAIM